MDPLVALHTWRHAVREGLEEEAYAAADALVSWMNRGGFKLDDGATQDFDADIGLAQHAARLFTRPVRVLVTYTIAGDNASEGRIEELDSWQSVDEFREEPLVAFDAVRALARDEKIRASDWLDELFDEED